MAPRIIYKKEMLPLLERIDLLAAMEEGFIAYSQGKAVVPPVGELVFEDPAGEAHIKYGYIKEDDYYVIKIASGFYNNPQLNIPSSQGLMLVFSQKTGEPVAVLLDEGWLTDIRTAAAGALVAKHFAPKIVSGIGIIGTGTQARMQLRMLNKVTDCKQVFLWGQRRAQAEKLQAELSGEYVVAIEDTPAEVAKKSNLIITTTPATAPLLMATDIGPGTHITAVGSDTATKQELDGHILQKADLVISDSLPQAQSRGEIYRAAQAGLITINKVVELGTALQDRTLQRQNDAQISVADLTGVAVQDIMIAKAVWLNS